MHCCTYITARARRKVCYYYLVSTQASICRGDLSDAEAASANKDVSVKQLNPVKIKVTQ